MHDELVEVHVVVAHRANAVWQVIGAPELYPRFFRGVSCCEQVGAEGRRPGAWYTFRLCLDGKTMLVEKVQALIYRPGDQIVWSSERSPDNWISMQLVPVQDGATEIRVQLATTDNGRQVGFGLSPTDVDRWLKDASGRIGDHLAAVPVPLPEDKPDGDMKPAVIKVLARAGMMRPILAARQLATIRKWGATVVGGYAAAAAVQPKGVAVKDQRGSLSFGKLDERSTRLAIGLSDLGIGAGTRVALLCRNHGGMLESIIACGKLGADVVLLNTGLSATAVSDVVDDHAVTALLVDDELAPLTQHVPSGLLRLSTWPSGQGREHTINELISASAPTKIRPPERMGRVVVLTSGTAGTPKGARRPTPKGPGSAAAVLSRIPLHVGERMFVAAPLFHTWGFSAMQLAMALRASLTLQRKFDAEQTLRAIAENRCTALIAVPIMLQRILDLPDQVRSRYDLSSLRIVASAGAALPGHFVTEFMDAFGDILYNVYGTTEVSWVSIADPADLRAAPTTAGRCPLGTRISILDDAGNPAPPGNDGHIHVGNHMLFDGYTDGSRLPVRHALMATGDRGYLDADGRLFISGRSDEMIVSGGENVFPRPVEDVLAALPQVRDVAVIGVPDKEYGQRLAAYIVLRPGARLDADSIRSYVRARLARFAVPRDVFFVGSLPRNATGKILKRLLAEGAW